MRFSTPHILFTLRFCLNANQTFWGQTEVQPNCSYSYHGLRMFVSDIMQEPEARWSFDGTTACNRVSVRYAKNAQTARPHVLPSCDKIHSSSFNGTAVLPWLHSLQLSVWQICQPNIDCNKSVSSEQRRQTDLNMSYLSSLCGSDVSSATNLDPTSSCKDRVTLFPC